MTVALCSNPLPLSRIRKLQLLNEDLDCQERNWCHSHNQNSTNMANLVPRVELFVQRVTLILPKNINWVAVVVGVGMFLYHMMWLWLCRESHCLVILLPCEQLVSALRVLFCRLFMFVVWAMAVYDAWFRELHCVVPENIHTSLTEGMFSKTPPPTPTHWKFQ